MIQYAKLHQKDVISVIIPNFFSSPTVSLFWRSAKPGTSVVEVPGQELARPL